MSYKYWRYQNNYFQIYFRNNWWNLNIFIYDDKGDLLRTGKEYSLTRFIPHFVKKYLTNRYIRKGYR